MDKIVVVVWIVFAIYLMVLMAILADLWSGVRKARKVGIARTSYGFRRTVDKLARYYNVLVILTIVDCLQMGAIWYIETYYNYHFVMFPFVTLLGGIGLCIIELKSIYEKAEDKVRFDSAADLIAQIINHKADPGAISDAIEKYMKDKENSKEK